MEHSMKSRRVDGRDVPYCCKCGLIPKLNELAPKGECEGFYAGTRIQAAAERRAKRNAKHAKKEQGHE